VPGTDSGIPGTGAAQYHTLADKYISAGAEGAPAAVREPGHAAGAPSVAWDHNVGGVMNMSSTYEDLVVPTIAVEPSEAEAEVTTPAAATASSSAAARLLEIAARNADQLLAEAEAEADEMRASARAEADEVLTEARTEAERVRSELEQSRIEANDEIAKLRETEQQHRDRMREHLHELMAKVEANSIV
jgi:hypothetical protein